MALERWLNNIFYVNDAVKVENFNSDIVYLNYKAESLEETLLSLNSEGIEEYLCYKKETENEISVGFVVKIPVTMATPDNLATIRKWVEYYRMAGTTYKIEVYG